MATRNFAEMAQLVDTKVSEMMDALDALLKSDASENTKRTQKFQRQTAIRNMLVFKAVLEKHPKGTIDLEGDLDKWFTSMVTLTAERKAAVTVEVKEGDNIMQLMEEHKDTKDIYKKMMAAAEKAGLKADFAKGIFVKK